jgi:hypothetical protein
MNHCIFIVYKFLFTAVLTSSTPSSIGIIRDLAPGPVCNRSSLLHKEARIAFKMAKTKECRQQIVNVACSNEAGSLYSMSLRSLPSRQGHQDPVQVRDGEEGWGEQEGCN